MVAVVDGGFSPSDQQRSGLALHRLVAVAGRPDELYAGTDLVRRLGSAAHADVLLVTDGDDGPASTNGDPDEGADDPDGTDDSENTDAPPAHPPGPTSDVGTLARERARALGLRVEVHRLALPVPSDVRPRDVDDVVAAISELVGFDPEPGVGCVVPIGVYEEMLLPGAADGPVDVMVGRAVERIVAVYRLPLLTYVPRF